MTANSHEIADKDHETDRFHHDLRTHLSAIVSLTDLIKKTPEPQDCAPLLDALHLAADNAMAIVEGGTNLQSSPGRHPEQLLRLLGSFDQLATGLARAHHTQFALHISDDLRTQAPLTPDPVYLHRVLMLLLDNALKYADGAPILLNVTLSRQGRLELDFSDTGPGFRGQDPALLFEPYHRGITSPAVAGTGLGLWSARHIVSMMNGQITARENTPSGAKFSISLPLKTATKDADLRNTKHHAPSTHPLQVLVVDDNQTNHLILGEMLQAMDCVPIHASSGPEALKHMSKRTLDLAIIDIRMAEMDGWELARRIRHGSLNATIPLIALSSDAAPAKTEPFDKWVQRPLDPAKLHELLSQVGQIAR